VSFSVRWCVVR